MFTTISPFGRRWKSGRITLRVHSGTQPAGKICGHPDRGRHSLGLKKFHGLDLEAAEDVPISAFPHKRDYKAVTVTTSMDQLIEAAMNQNFVPVVDDRGIFIGIVRRQAIIRYCYEKARTEQQAHEQRISEYAAVH